MAFQEKARLTERTKLSCVSLHMPLFCHLDFGKDDLNAVKFLENNTCSLLKFNTELCKAKNEIPLSPYSYYSHSPHHLFSLRLTTINNLLFICPDLSITPLFFNGVHKHVQICHFNLQNKYRIIWFCSFLLFFSAICLDNSFLLSDLYRCTRI